MDGVEQDTIMYGTTAPIGMNYGRILGAEQVVKALSPNPKSCLVACDPSYSPSHSAVLRTLNVTRGYVQLANRSSHHVLFEQWQAFPNVTGPESVKDTEMWMASQAAAIVLPKV
eukprot:m.10105 g.10105  ORF g.10105 m.10105 type:complete len:114 (+) comp4270_c0_seq1:831-1172(+)